MKKLLKQSLLAALFLSQAALHAAAEREQQQLDWSFSQACAGFHLQEIERSPDAGAVDILRDCDKLLHATIDYKPASVAEVKLLISKGCSVGPVGGSNLLECALEKGLDFDSQKAKMEVLLEAGVHVDWNKIEEIRERELAGAQKRAYYPLVYEHWEKLMDLIAGKVLDDEEFCQGAYPLLLEILPVYGVADLAGQYTVAYWDGRNQTPVGGAPEGAPEQKDGEQPVEAAI